MQYKYIEAYNCVKAPADLKAKVMSAADRSRRFNYKSLISVAACVIILTAFLPTYVGLTAPTITVTENAPVVARYVGVQLPLEFNLNRKTDIELSHGTLDGYDGNSVSGCVSYTWIADTTDSCTITLKDALKTTEYVLNYNEKNDSWSIIKN